MKRLRSVLFWLHLTAGLVAGSIIFIMSFTGVLLAFEHEIVEWAERDVRRVTPPAPDAPRLPLDDLIARATTVATTASSSRSSAGDGAGADADTDAGPPRSAAPVRATGVTVSADPRDAVAVAFGRDAGTYYVNPYTGEARTAATTRTHDFMHLMIDWHRALALSGDNRATGRAITGACNTAFLVLGLTGLYLWWPRNLRVTALKPLLWFTGARGKARDWNWHNVYGFWFLPVLIVLTASGMVISYRWASDLVYRAAGEAPSAPPAPAPAASPTSEYAIERPADGGARLDFDGALAALQREFPAWTQITLREGLPRRRGAPPPPSSSAGDGAGTTARPSADSPREQRRERVPQPYSATIRADDGSPVFASTQVVLHPFSGELLDRSGYAEQTPGRKARSWLRFLHTGQALGWIGQLVAGLACVGGCILVYTGFALSWRRFFSKKRPA